LRLDAPELVITVLTVRKGEHAFDVPSGDGDSFVITRCGPPAAGLSGFGGDGAVLVQEDRVDRPLIKVLEGGDGSDGAAEERRECEALQVILAGLERGLTLLPASSSWRPVVVGLRSTFCRAVGRRRLSAASPQPASAGPMSSGSGTSVSKAVSI
jgi:hypothetical protein